MRVIRGRFTVVFCILLIASFAAMPVYAKSAHYADVFKALEKIDVNYNFLDYSYRVFMERPQWDDKETVETIINAGTIISSFDLNTLKADSGIQREGIQKLKDYLEKYKKFKSLKDSISGMTPAYDVISDNDISSFDLERVANMIKKDLPPRAHEKKKADQIYSSLKDVDPTSVLASNSREKEVLEAITIVVTQYPAFKKKYSPEPKPVTTSSKRPIKTNGSGVATGTPATSGDQRKGGVEISCNEFIDMLKREAYDGSSISWIAQFVAEPDYEKDRIDLFDAIEKLYAFSLKLDLDNVSTDNCTYKVYRQNVNALRKIKAAYPEFRAGYDLWLQDNVPLLRTFSRKLDNRTDFTDSRNFKHLIKFIENVEYNYWDKARTEKKIAEAQCYCNEMNKYDYRKIVSKENDYTLKDFVKMAKLCAENFESVKAGYPKFIAENDARIAKEKKAEEERIKQARAREAERQKREKERAQKISKLATKEGFDGYYTSTLNFLEALRTGRMSVKEAKRQLLYIDDKSNFKVNSIVGGYVIYVSTNNRTFDIDTIAVDKEWGETYIDDSNLLKGGYKFVKIKTFSNALGGEVDVPVFEREIKLK